MASVDGGGDAASAEINGHHKKHHHSSKNHSHSSSKHHSSSKSSSSSSKHHSSSHKSSHKSRDESSSHKSSRDSSSHKSSHDSSKHSSSSGHHKHSSSKSKSSHHSKERHSSHGSSKDKHRSEVKSERSSSSSPSKVKQEPHSPVKQHKPVVSDDDDLPLNQRLDQAGLLTAVKDEKRGWSDDEEPLSARMEKAKKVKKEDVPERKRKVEDEDYASPKTKKIKKEAKAAKPETKKGGRKKEENDELKEDKWEWWKDDARDEGVKWVYLEHQGPMFAPDYEPLPDHVHFYYGGKRMKLSPEAEEVAGFYGKMLEHDYTTKEIFNKNFLKDWRKVMTHSEKEIITDLTKCNFREICDHFQRLSEERKSMSKEEKQKIKKQNEDIVKQYGFCVIDHHRQKIGNFRIEPPGLFRGRGDHPKQGMLKKRTQAEDVIINCSKDAPVPKPPPGHKWKEVRHDKTVTWLACWTENVQNSTKYVMLNAASKLKGEKDWKKYETARNLHRCVDKIRAQYREDFKSKEMRVRQRSVAMYFIDKLALRAGNEKDEDTADTVGCCSIRVEHIKLHEQLDGKENVVEFDFLGKDSIRYYNRVSVEKRVFKNLQLFMENKVEGDDLFDRLNTAVLNKHLQSLMDGLTAKVFRTYNASRTLQEQLKLLTQEDDNVTAKMLSYNRANRAVAILCNHQRAVPKNFSKQMENLQTKIDNKLEDVMKAKQDYKAAKADYKALKTEAKKKVMEKKKKAIERLQEQHHKLEVQQTDKDENKEIALGTSKLNYLDPRISVAWCKKHEVPIEKVYNKTQREKFAWAIDMADEDFEF